jgi:hypothetical protein
MAPRTHNLHDIHIGRCPVNRAKPPRTLRTLLATTALLVLTAGLAATLTQCRMVTDSQSGDRGATSANVGNCVSECAHQYNDSIRVESDLHVANVHACGADTVCQAAEEARHDAAVDRIQNGRHQCQDQCRHEQGGGKGGR